MRPASIVLFERLILAALAIDLVNNLAVALRPPAAGAAASVASSAGPAAGIALALASPLLGLILWYFVARRGSNIARWLTTILVALGTAGFVGLAFRGIPTEARTMVAVGAFAELLKVAAVVCLFTGPASAWFARHRVA